MAQERRCDIVVSATTRYLPDLSEYQMVAEDGTRFDAPIPEFTLSVPRVLY